MKFQDLAGIIGKSSGAVRVAFSRHGWSISQSADVAAYLEFVNRPTRYTTPRPASTADHLAKYRFHSSAELNRLLPTLSEDFRQPETRDLENWLRRARFHGLARQLSPEARHAFRELAQGLLATSRDLTGIIITSPHLAESPTRLIGIIGIYSWLPGNSELARVATNLAERQSVALGMPVHYHPTDLVRLESTLQNSASNALKEWLTVSRVEYGYATLPL